MVVSDRDGAKNGWLGQFTQLAVAEATDKRARWRRRPRSPERTDVRRGRAAASRLDDRRTDWLARRVARSLRGSRAHFAAHEADASLDSRGARARGRPVTLIARRAIHALRRPAADALSHGVAYADSREDCCPVGPRALPRLPRRWATNPRPHSTVPSRSWSARHRRRGAGNTCIDDDAVAEKRNGMYRHGEHTKEASFAAPDRGSSAEIARLAQSPSVNLPCLCWTSSGQTVIAGHQGLAGRMPRRPPQVRSVPLANSSIISGHRLDSG